MANPVVHLELHTGNLARACAFYSQLLGWRPERIAAGERSYQALDVGRDLSGGVVECGAEPASWLPYVSVPSVARATDEAERLGAAVLLAPREGPAGWRSVVAAPDAGQVAFWEAKVNMRSASMRA
jgi:predicted enzyme related to lactoylglutathione lyase